MLCLCISVCEYYAHLECQDFVVSDCKECATYVPTKEKVKQYAYSTRVLQEQITSTSYDDDDNNNNSI